MAIEVDGGDLLAVDFDKTLTDPDNDEWAPADEQEPNPSVIESVTEAYKNGVHVVIWTARQWNEAPKVAGWLTAHEVPFHGIRCGKGGATVYIDDKTIPPESVLKTDDDIEENDYTDSTYDPVPEDLAHDTHNTSPDPSQNYGY